MSISQEELDEMLKRNPDLAIDDGKLKDMAVIGAGLGNFEEWTMRKNKYNVSNKEDRTYGGITYASKKEANFACTLNMMLKAGEIDYVLRQVPFELGVGIIYKADFVTFKADPKIHPDTGLWTIAVYEIKGMWTDVARLKMKLFKEKFPNLTLEII